MMFFRSVAFAVFCGFRSRRMVTGCLSFLPGIPSSIPAVMLRVRAHTQTLGDGGKGKYRLRRKVNRRLVQERLPSPKHLGPDGTDYKTYN
jgi:hypothetical protein